VCPWWEICVCSPNERERRIAIEEVSFGFLFLFLCLRDPGQSPLGGSR